jgi:hypothetical protein
MAVTINGTTGITGNSGTLISASTIGVGGATPAASGAGITFPATASASSDANTLDDYEEGTWTPTIFGTTTAGTGTYNAQDGKYTKVGRTVTIVGFIWVLTHTGTGNMRMSGLPFTTGDSTPLTMGETGNLSLSANNVPQMITLTASTNIAFSQTPVGGGGDAYINIDTAFYTRFSGTYFV